jgi:predicted enzyme related to lactoylglutathione lyase
MGAQNAVGKPIAVEAGPAVEACQASRARAGRNCSYPVVFTLMVQIEGRWFKEPMMTIRNALASVAVQDVKSASAWYEKLLDASPSRPMPEVAEWRFERGGALQVYQLPERAGAGSVTLVVDDIEQQARHLSKLNIEGGERHDGPRVKTIMITDPDGNHIAFAQALDPSLAR